MLVTLAPHADPKIVRDDLLRLANDAGNLRATQYGIRRAYLTWATEAARLLRFKVSADDIDRLILTKRYWALWSHTLNVATSDGAELEQLVRTEIDDVELALGVARQALDEQIKRWAFPAEFVVADSSFYVEAPKKLEDLVIADVLRFRGEPVHMLVPILVIDELDNLKRSSDRSVRWRAAHTLGQWSGLFTTSSMFARFRDQFRSSEEHGFPRGPVTMEVVFDPPGHRRLPIADDEIVARAVAIQGLAGRNVTFVTYDTGQVMRARAAGLRVVQPEERRDKKVDEAGS